MCLKLCANCLAEGFHDLLTKTSSTEFLDLPTNGLESTSLHPADDWLIDWHGGLLEPGSVDWEAASHVYARAYGFVHGTLSPTASLLMILSQSFHGVNLTRGRGGCRSKGLWLCVLT